MMHRRCKINHLYLVIICLSILSCFNPFFPQTGIPPSSSVRPTDNTLRSTPLGVIRQLIDAYQKKNIDLYRELFSVQQDFRFYVPPGFESIHLIKTCERVDTALCSYIASKGLTCVNYWTYAEEMRSHAHLFEQAEQITLNCTSIESDDIRYISNENHETTNVEIIMRGGALTVDDQIQSDDQGNTYQYTYEVADIGQQVFYLEKDPQNKSLWVIQKWFDLQSMQ
jgi:hypothetical protein